MEMIKVIRELITEEESNFFIEYINNNLAKFDDYSGYGNPDRHAWRFGVDDVYLDSNHTLDKVLDIKDKVLALFDRITQKAKEAYSNDKDLYVTSFHLGKQMKNSMVNTHLDADKDHNGHFKYSCVLYLNSSNHGGKLHFSKLELYYQPIAGAAILFPSQGEEFEHQVFNITEPRYSIPMWLTETPSLEIKFS